jgi:hypothetical protein
MTVCAAAAVKIVKAMKGSRKLFKATRTRRRKKSSLISNLSELLDLEWIEQRLYDLEEGPDAPIGARNIGHIFREDSNTTGGEELAAILVIGEREDIIEIMDLLPLERVPRVPRVAEFFKLEKRRNWFVNPLPEAPIWEYRWYRKFLGTYARNLALESRRIVHVPSSPALSSLASPSAASYSGTSANTQTGSKKRKLSSQSSVDLGDRDEDDTEQPAKILSYSG